jgi:hypothetical protein
MDVRIDAVPNVGATCYLLQAFVILYLIGGWKEGSSSSTIGSLSMRMLRSMDPSNKEEANPSDLVEKIVESLFPGEKSQQCVYVAFELISGGLQGTPGQHQVSMVHWTSCPCGLESVKKPVWESVIVVSTAKEIVNLEDIVNSEVGADEDTEDGWKCPSTDCERRKDTTKLSTRAEVGKFVIFHITRPLNRPRTSVRVPKEMMIATYQEGKIGATLVPAYLVYVVCHSTKGGDVPDEGHPDSVGARNGGHYFGCLRSQNGVDGITMDCLADPGDNRAVNFNNWVDERTKKVSMVVYTTEKPSWSGANLLPGNGYEACKFGAVCQELDKESKLGAAVQELELDNVPTNMKRKTETTTSACDTCRLYGGHSDHCPNRSLENLAKLDELEQREKPSWSGANLVPGNGCEAWRRDRNFGAAVQEFELGNVPTDRKRNHESSASFSVCKQAGM